MWGRKDKKEKRGERRKGNGAGKGGAGLPFMGLGVPPHGAEESEEALEAELLALQGKSPSKGKKPAKSSKVMSMNDIDTMVAGLDGMGEESDEGEESDGEDDSDLLAELREIAEDSEEDETPPTAPPTVTPTAPLTRQPGKDTVPPVQSAQMAAITERLASYEKAILEAKSKGESSKVRRYTRAMETIKTLQKKAQSGKSVDLDDLPPPVASGGGGGGGGGGPQPTTVAPPPPPPQEEIADDELMAWANSSPGPSLEPPKPKPRPQAVPPQPKPCPPAPPTTSDGRIDLDAPEFDEFNLSDEDLAMLAAQMTQSSSQPSAPQPKPRPQVTPPKPKPRPPPPPTTNEGRIDLDAPEFDEFNLSDEDLAMLAAQMESSKKQKLVSSDGPAAVPTQSLPVTLPPPRGSPSRQEVQAVLAERRDQYAAAMRHAKTQRSTAREREFGKMAAQFSRVLKALGQGQDIDVSQVPPPPPGYTSKFHFDLSKYKPVTTQTSPRPSAVAVETPRGSTVSSSQDSEPAEANSSIPVPKTVMEALEQRLAKYEATQRAAQENGESSRARRMTRIVKQYQEAIKTTRAGKPYSYSELPDPPGYPPIPVPRAARPTASLPPALPKPTQSLPPQRTTGGSKFMPNPTVSHDQMNFLTRRQKELLEAVKEAKVKGDRQTALHYLKQYKGMEQMIVAAGNGLPVDLSQAPPSPFADLSKTKPASAVLSHLKPASEGDNLTFDRIKKQLQTQIDRCTSNAKSYEEIKNVGTATQYQNMCRELQQELLAIEGIQSQGLAPPKFTMETRKFAIVHTHMYLSAQQCEVEVVKATAIPKPDGFEEKDLNVYVEIEFPWPSDEAQKVCTESVKGTSSPEFNHKEKFDIERKHTRSILRIFKRNPLKCSIWQKRTLRKHIFVGQALLQLDKLETRCEVRITADLLDERGRKAVGGKMELVARLREPFTGKDTEEKEEQWLVFQETIATTSAVQMPRPSPVSSAPSQNPALLSPMKIENTTSMEALKVELSLVQSALKSGHKDATTVQKGRQIQARLQVIRQRLQSDAQFRTAYLRQVAKEIQLERTLESRLAQAGRNKEAKILQLRRQAMQQELKTSKK